MYKHYSKIIKHSLLFLLVSSILYGATTATTRVGDVKNDSISSSVPYSFHYEKFQSSTIKTFSDLDLSAHSEMKLFMGYGLSDKKEQNCYYVDHAANANVLTDFEAPKVINDKSYLVSRAKMTYSNCKNLATRYAGYVYTPNSITRDSEIERRYRDKDFWIGLSKFDCSSEWINDYGIAQGFNRVADENCDPNSLNISARANSYIWDISSASESHYCMLQLDSRDYLRPIKVCAPWWQIEQEYALDCNATNTTNLLPFYNIKVPKKFSVCTDNDTNTSSGVSEVDAYETLYDNIENWNTFPCTSYYSMNAGESCKENMLQEQCYVNECSGGIERTCRLQKSFVSDVKDYAIGVVADKYGEMKKVKTKDKIKTFEYLCPPAKPSIAGCEKYEEVELFPTDECKPGGCDRYFDCITSSPNNISACDTLKSGCERQYGYDIMVVNGKASYALVRCEDGREIKNYNINSISTVESRCSEYEVVETYESSYEMCEASLIESKHSVRTGLSDTDIYHTDDNCVRLNNEETVPEDSYFLEFNTTDFFNTKISKVTTLIPESELNSTSGTPSIVIGTLEDGNYSIDIYDGNNTSLGTDTLSSIADVFAQLNSIVVGSDRESLYYYDDGIEEFSADEPVNTNQPIPEVVYDYFSKKWWSSRVYLFNDPSLNSITRPYSAFAQCAVDLVETNPATAIANYIPDYQDGTPVEGSEVIRENFESNAFMEQYSDQDIMDNGLYCRRGSNEQYVDWYGTDDNELYYNEYNCSRLYGSDGELWTSPYEITFSTEHSEIKVSGSTIEHTATVYDYASELVFSSKSECESETGETCTEYGSVFDIVETDPIEREGPHCTNYTDSIYLGNKQTKCYYNKSHAIEPRCADGYFLVGESRCNYNICNNGTSFTADESACRTDCTVYSGYVEKNGRCENNVRYIPTSYNSYGSASARKYETVKYYEYQCPDGYTAQDSGLSSYSILDQNRTAKNEELFVSPNSDTPAIGNCVIDNASEIEGNIKDYFEDVMENPINGDYCRQVEDIENNETFQGVKTEQTYECSKYFDSNGDWVYMMKTFYLYNATNFKRFRQDSCSYGDFNGNNVSKSGDNAVMYDTTNTNFLTTIQALDTYSEHNMDLRSEDNSFYPIPQDKLVFSELNTEGTIKVIDKSLDSMDDLFEIYRVDGQIRLISIDFMSESNCITYRDDLAKSNYDIVSNISRDKCIIDMDYFGGPRFDPVEVPTVVIPQREGSFDFNLTGLNSIVTIESYLDGDFGYKSNHASPLYRDTHIKIENREVYPIVNMEEDYVARATLNYKRAINERLETSRGELVPSPASLEAQVLVGGAAAAGTAGAGVTAAGAVAMPAVAGAIALSSLGAAIVILVPALYVINLFGDKKEYATLSKNIELYLDRDSYRYFPNVYGNDKRIIGEDKLTYYTMNFSTGRKDRAYSANSEASFMTTNTALMNDLYNLDDFTSILRTQDGGIQGGFPNMDWWEGGTKTNSGSWSFDDNVSKSFNMVYYGATNSISIFVPYKGDYELLAIDKKGNIIGKKVIFATNFISNGIAHPYHQVYFTTDENFNLADGIADGNTTGACRYSPVAEWGGGVSGAYYSFGTGNGYTCDKSNDEYVQEHSAYFLALRLVGSEQFNIIGLKHPMPFANKVFVVSPQYLETREYSCFEDNNCTVE